MSSITDWRPAIAVAIALATAVLAGCAEIGTFDLQPITLPVVFGVALAAAIDPQRWLIHVGVVAAGLVLFDLFAQTPGGRGVAFSAIDMRALVDTIVPATIGAALVRFACRSAM